MDAPHKSHFKRPVSNVGPLITLGGIADKGDLDSLTFWAIIKTSSSMIGSILTLIHSDSGFLLPVF